MRDLSTRRFVVVAALAALMASQNMAKIPWFKCYAGDLLGALAEMTPFEAALYVTCLLRMYDEDGPIRNNIDQLARRCNMRLPTCVKALDSLVRRGKLVIENDLISNPRATRELHLRAQYKQIQKTNRAKRPTKSIEPTNDGTTEELPARACQKPDIDINKNQQRRRPTLEAALARSREEFLKTNPLVNQKPNGSASRNYPQSLGAIIGTGADRPKGGPDYDDPAVRKQRWQQKLDNWLTSALGLESKFVVELWQRHQAGDPDAVKAINGFAADMKAEEEAIRKRAS